MDRRLVMLSFLALAACSKGDAPAPGTPSSTAATTRDSAGGTVSAAAVNADAAPSAGAANAASPATGADAGAAPANQMGKIPILEYHIIGGEKNGLYSRTVASYKADLDAAYRLGYRPITVAQMLDKDFRDVPAGMSPVIFVYDDASDSQFRYLDQGGKLVVDPTSGLGVWEAFARAHPGWKSRGTYCMLSGGAAGHNFFGDSPKFNGQKKEWRFQKVKYLADQGYELCDHTVWHAMLNKYPDTVVQEQIARNAMSIDSAVPGYKIRTMALPYGLWPKNRPLAWQGTWTDPKTGKAHPYKFEAVLEVAGGPAKSPFDPTFNPKSINRIQAVGDDIVKQLQRLADTKTRFVVGK